MKTDQEDIKAFWDKRPCGTRGVVPENITKEYFEAIEKRRYELEPFIKGVVGFQKFRDKRVLEIGCGVGTDGLQFRSAGAVYEAVDMSEKSVALARENHKLRGYNGCEPSIKAVESEILPFPDAAFDFVYSWGAIHHSPDISKSVQEIYRVLKPGGECCIMIYNRRSLVGFQLYLLYGFGRFQPCVSLMELFAKHHESPDTQAFTDREAKNIFRQFSDVKITNIVTPYDLRITRNKFMPRLMRKLIPRRFGLFKVIKAVK